MPNPTPQAWPPAPFGFIDGTATVGPISGAYVYAVDDVAGNLGALSGIPTGTGTNHQAKIEWGGALLPSTFCTSPTSGGTVVLTNGSVGAAVGLTNIANLIASQSYAFSDFVAWTSASNGASGGTGGTSTTGIALEGTLLNSGTAALGSLTVSAVQYAAGSSTTNYRGLAISFYSATPCTEATFTSSAAIVQQDAPTTGWFILDRLNSIASNSAFVVNSGALAQLRSVVIGTPPSCH